MLDDQNIAFVKGSTNMNPGTLGSLKRGNQVGIIHIGKFFAQEGARTRQVGVRGKFPP